VEWIGATLAAGRATGAIAATAVRRRRNRITEHGTLGEALRGAGWVQESGPERLPTKRAIYAELDRYAEADAILASSTSALDMTEIAAGLTGAWRCVVAHPTNPPHVIPAVEVVPGAATRTDVVRRAAEFLASVGQTPVVLRAFVPGFLMNRMQAALVREAIALVARGVADAAAVDAVIRDGIGLRWALFGPFGAANTNADGGVREYFTRYRTAFQALWSDLMDSPTLTAELIERLGAMTDDMEGRVPRADLRRWRDDLVARIRDLRAAHPHPGRADGTGLLDGH
jgi:3-hydroxyacyl-CoA dehydrogenase